jgi:hypothetical protein
LELPVTSFISPFRYSVSFAARAHCYRGASAGAMRQFYEFGG